MDALSCRIIVPIYRSELSPDEEISLRSIRKHLSGYELCFAAPESLDLTGILHEGEKTERFQDEFFHGIAGYNRLLKSRGFYERFENFDYILIAQLDCLIFGSNLNEWMACGWDYLASPWFHGFSEDANSGLWRVGNGGLSLRKVASYLRILQQKVVKGSIYPRWGHYAWKPPFESMEPGLYQRVSAIYCMKPLANKHMVEDELSSFSYNEDVFWAIEAPKFDPTFKVAAVEEALGFAFEVAPRWSLEHTNNQLPFGCHAWTRYDREFWNDIMCKANVLI